MTQHVPSATWFLNRVPADTTAKAAGKDLSFLHQQLTAIQARPLLKHCPCYPHNGSEPEVGISKERCPCTDLLSMLWWKQDIVWACKLPPISPQGQSPSV